MKNILNIGLLSLVILFTVSCDDDKDQSFTRLYVSGPSLVAPETSGTYSLGLTPGTFTWTISDASVAEFASSSSGATAEVNYLKFGSFRINANNGSMDGWLDVTVSEVGAGVTASYHYGAVNNGGVDTLFLTFDSPLAETPEVVINGAEASDTSAYNKGVAPFISTGNLLTALTLKGSKYWALYTGGSGDGQPEGRLTKVTPDAAYSDTAIDSVYFKLPMVDNSQPNVLENDGPSTGIVTWGSEVEYSVTFNEAMRATFATSADSAIWLHFDYTRKVDGVDKAVEDSLEFTSDDMKTWSLTYTVSDSIDDGGVVALSRGLGEWVDIAGNAYLNSPAPAPTPNLTIDTAAPTTPATGVTEPSATPVDSDRWLDLTANSNDGAGIGVAEYHYMIKEAYESDTTAAGVNIAGPKSVSEFSGGTVTGATASTSVLMSTDSARYDLFWIAVDKFGYESGVDSTRLAYDENGVLTID